MRLLIIGMAFAMAGCATSYRATGFAGGFSETALAPNIYRVDFVGNGFTSGQRAEELALLRSADLTLQRGYRFFALADSRNAQSLSSFITPVQSNTTFQAQRLGNSVTGSAYTNTTGGQTMYVSKPSTSNIVVMFSDRPIIDGMVFDASFLCSSIGPKYKAVCGQH